MSGPYVRWLGLGRIPIPGEKRRLRRATCGRCGCPLSFCNSRCLHPETEAFERGEWETLVEAIRTRHNNPQRDAVLGIDPDEPEELAAIAILAIRPGIERLAETLVHQRDLAHRWRRSAIFMFWTVIVTCTCQIALAVTR